MNTIINHGKKNMDKPTKSMETPTHLSIAFCQKFLSQSTFTKLSSQLYSSSGTPFNFFFFCNLHLKDHVVVM